ncbi:MAG TPA: DUF1559 domain-containing protein [Pirellulaceae bacterium]|nr:DUF1559 domain-containing protein [Pirellulaceae bacterium]
MVISIIGVLMALLLPAVNAARATMWKAECANNIKQLALATTNWSTAKQMRLPGYAEPVGGKRMPWSVAMMPYIEQQQLYDQYRGRNLIQVIPPNYGSTAPPFSEPFIQSYVCAADGDKGALDGPQMSYVANVGMALAFPVPAPAPSTPAPAYKANGVFQSAEGNPAAGLPETKLNLAGVSDGAAYTVAFSENIQAVTYGLPEGYDPSDPDEEARFRLSAGFQWYANPASGLGINEPKATFKSSAYGNAHTNQASARPSSFHAGGVNMGFVDGHVQFIPDNVDYAVYMQLMTPDSVKSDAPNVQVPTQPPGVTYKNVQIPWADIN